MKPFQGITVIQATTVLASSIIGVGVLPLPLFAVRAAGTGAPVVALLALGIAFVGGWTAARLAARFPGKPLAQYAETLLGRWPAAAGSSLVMVFFAIVTGLAAREFGSVVITSVLRNTPIEVTVIVMLLLAAISSRQNLQSFAYIHMFYTPIILLPVLIITVLSLQNANPLFLRPVFGNAPPDMAGGTLTIAALFQGSFVITVVAPCMRNVAKASVAAFAGIGIAGGLYLLIVIAALAVFGPEETQNLLWPTLELAKTTALPANVLERMDAAFLSIWVTAVFTSLLSSYYIVVHNAATLFRLRDHRLFTFFFLPFVFAIAMLPQNIVELYDVAIAAGGFGLLLTIGYPLLLLVVSAVRGIREDAA